MAVKSRKGKRKGVDEKNTCTKGEKGEATKKRRLGRGTGREGCKRRKSKVNGVGCTRERKGTAEGNKKTWKEGKRIKEKVRRM